MGFILKVQGADPIELGLISLTGLQFKTDIPDDSNARSTSVGSTMTIDGKILTATDGDPGDNTMKLFQWSLVPAERADCYRNFTIDVISANQVVRTINFPNAFVVDYDEDYSDQGGVGTFRLIVKQKKDKLDKIMINGGYPG